MHFFVARRDQLLPDLHEHMPPVVLCRVTAFAVRVRELLQFIGQLMHCPVPPWAASKAPEGGSAAAPGSMCVILHCVGHGGVSPWASDARLSPQACPPRRARRP